jgi:hypothetical protein
MLSLSNYLTSMSIHFNFDPRCLGLDREMKVKYFLQEFMVDPDHKMDNFRTVERQISTFFKDFRESHTKNEETSTDYTERLSVDTVMLPYRMLVKQDRKSWDTGINPMSADRIKKKLLSDRIENSKKRSM